MGYNTTVMIVNDALNEIENDKEFGKNLVSAIMRTTITSGSIAVPVGNYCNAVTVVEQHHADNTVLVSVGGNYGCVFGECYGYSHHTPKDKENILRKVAKDMGFDLRRRSK